MEVINSVLTKVYYSDIVDGIFTFPEGVTEIEDYVFEGYNELKEIEIPDTVTKIGIGAFYECKNLEKIKLSKKINQLPPIIFEGCISLTNIEIPSNVTKIGYHAFRQCQFKNINLPKNLELIDTGAFESCTSLEKITIPPRVKEIGSYAFDHCSNLKKIELPDSITKIGRGSFYSCHSLENIRLPKSLVEINLFLFGNCKSLKEINMPENIAEIRIDSFKGCYNLKKIITPWGEYNSNINSGVINKYLYLYANSILKKKYNNITEFLSNPYIKGIVVKNRIISSENAIIKFKNLFYKMRKDFNVEPRLFERLSLKTTEKFNLKIWNKIYPIFFFAHFHTDTSDMQEAFSELIEIFGLFEKDFNQGKRLENFINLFSKKFYKLTNDQCNDLLFHADIEIDNLYTQTNTNYLVLKNNIEIPQKFSIYLKKELNEEMIKKIKKLSGTYGKQINDFIKENYVPKMVEEFKLKDEKELDEATNLIIFKRDLNGLINYSSLHRMFDGCKKEYNEEFYNFIMDNLIFILNDEKLQSNLKNIQAKFSAIKSHYLNTSGTKNITLKQAIDYLENETFEYHDGNYELSQDVKKAGVSSQNTFDYYQRVFENNDTRQLSSLVKRSNIYEIDGYTIKAELLRRDDSFAMLVGETNYTNCCQVFGGVGHNCMAHATNSNDGGIFVTRLLKDNKWILLTQSWDWQNNNVYCHDNIEATSYLKNNPNLKKIVAKIYELDGKYIIEKSKQEVEKYIKARKKIIEKSLSNNKEKELQELRSLEAREIIRVVTTGSDNDDLELSNYFSKKIDVNNDQLINGRTFTLQNFQPVDYNSSQVYFNNEEDAYTDSSTTQYIIAGSIEELCVGKLEPLVPLYRDERRIFLEQGENIRNYTTQKIKNIEKIAFPQEMYTHQNETTDCFEDYNIYLGEDWYLIYEEYDDNFIYIHDLAKIKPALEDEISIQNQEIMNVIYDLVRKYDQIEADLKEDTSYLLFLINKKLGYFEQIGDDISYPFSNQADKKYITEEEQNQILKNSRKIKEDKNLNNIMHNITFKKGRLLNQKVLNNKKR